MRSKLSLLGILLVLVAVNVSIALKERALSAGRTVILELAPVDPRSLMQGDYMVLRYALADKVDTGLTDGMVYVKLDARNVATEIVPSPGPDTMPLRYRTKDGRAFFDAESYFFQEGQGHFFQDAKYGELKIDPENGMPMLVGLLDARLQPIRP